MSFVLRAMTTADVDRVLALNAANVPAVAALDLSELTRLQRVGCQAYVAIDVAFEVIAYALTFTRDDGDYDGEEFQLLCNLVPQSFLYIDQIAVASTHARQGIGRSFYEQLAEAALARGIGVLCCEVNIVPPNSNSLAFHRALGFEALRELATRDGRVVVLLRKPLCTAPARPALPG